MPQMQICEMGCEEKIRREGDLMRMPSLYRVKMLNLFKQFERNIVKDKLPYPYLNYRLVLKKGLMKKLIMKSKGWRTYTEAGKGLGLCRQYCCLLDHQNATATSTVITRIAAATGNVDGNWHQFFEIVPWGHKGFDSNHPSFNNEKYEGRIPYRSFSPSAESRRKDYDVEDEEF
jgi:hypothetical protein